MVVCGECGTRNAAGTQFCTVCGTFLEWESTPAATTVNDVEPPPADPSTTASGAGEATAATGATGRSAAAGTPVVVEQKPVVEQRNASPDAAGSGNAGPDVAGPKIVGPEVAGPKTVGPTTVGSTTAGSTTAGSTTAGSGAVGSIAAGSGAAGSEAAGSTGTSGQARQPSVVQPGDRRHRFQAAPTGDAPAWGPSDVVCPHCGVGNAANRKFCRSCAGMLVVQAPQERRSWWRRLLDALTRRRSHEAGTRRRVRSSRGWLRSLGIVAASIAALVAALSVLPTRGLISRAATNVRDRLADPAPVTPVRLEASSEIGGARARNVSDGASNRYWAPARGPVGAWVEAELPRPVRLLEVLVTSGVSKDKKLFVTQGRPRELAVTVTAKGGKVTRSTIVVQDKPGDQRFDLKASDAVRVRFTIVSTYGVSKGKVCAIGELEFFIRG